MVNLSDSILSPSDHSLNHERVSTFLVQTRIGIRWVDLPSLVSVDLTLIYLNDVFHSL